MEDFFYTFKDDRIKEPVQFTDCPCEIVKVQNGVCTVKACEYHIISIKSGSIKHISLGPAEPEINRPKTNWLEYQKEIINAICTIKNQTQRVTDHHIQKIGHKWPYKDQMTKIFEECLEISHAIENNDPENEREEYIDLIMSVMTLLHINEVTDDEIKQGVVKVLNKFVERGWLKP